MLVGEISPLDLQPYLPVGRPVLAWSGGEPEGQVPVAVKDGPEPR